MVRACEQEQEQEQEQGMGSGLVSALDPLPRSNDKQTNRQTDKHTNLNSAGFLRGMTLRANRVAKQPPSLPSIAGLSHSSIEFPHNASALARCLSAGPIGVGVSFTVNDFLKTQFRS